MAGKGGGAWKVAYADFVTAMMAFFLVMWITAQDQKIKQAVSYYFMDPMGSSKKAVKAGSVADHPETGPGMENTGSKTEKGRKSYSTENEPSPATKTVHDWLVADNTANTYWQQQAREARAGAQRSPEVKNKIIGEQEEAVRRLARQMQDEIKSGMPAKAKGLYQDLLNVTMKDVNWSQIAEDLLKD
jgi:flagellar motor protein MotB